MNGREAEDVNLKIVFVMQDSASAASYPARARIMHSITGI